MPPLVSTLLPSSSTSSSSPESLSHNFLLKLSNDQLFQLLKSYSLAKSSADLPKLIVKDNKISIKIDDESCLQVSELKEPNMDIYYSLLPFQQSESSICLNLGTINSRLSVKPPNSNKENNNNANSSANISKSRVNVDYLSFELLFAKIDIKLIIINTMAFNKVWNKEDICNKIEGHPVYSKLSLNIKALVDEIINETTDENRQLKTEYIHLLKSPYPPNSADETDILDDMNSRLDTLGYPKNHPMRLLITNDVSSLDYKPKKYNSENRVAPSSSTITQKSSSAIVSSDEEQERIVVPDSPQFSNATSAADSPSSTTSISSNNSAVTIASKNRKRTISSASTSSSSSTNSMESTSKRSKSRSPASSYDEDEGEYADELSAQKLPENGDYTFGSTSEKIGTVKNESTNDTDKKSNSNSAISRPSTPVTVYTTASNYKVAVVSNGRNGTANGNLVSDPLQSSKLVAGPQLKPIPKQPKSMLANMPKEEDKLKDNILRFNSLYVQYYKLYQVLENDVNKDEAKLRKLLKLHNDLTRIRWTLYNTKND